MLRFAADENLNYNILRGLLRRKADLNIARIQDVGLSALTRVSQPNKDMSIYRPFSRSFAFQF